MTVAKTQAIHQLPRRGPRSLLILAENTPAATFVDQVDRLNFDNWAEHEALYRDGKPINELPYPRAKSHRQVQTL